jgi:hypothetical protein
MFHCEITTERVDLTYFPREISQRKRSLDPTQMQRKGREIKYAVGRIKENVLKVRETLCADELGQTRPDQTSWPRAQSVVVREGSLAFWSLFFIFWSNLTYSSRMDFLYVYISPFCFSY